MINFDLQSLWLLIELAGKQYANAEANKAIPKTAPGLFFSDPKHQELANALVGVVPQLDPNEIKYINSFLTYAKRTCERFEATRSLTRLARIETDLSRSLDWTTYSQHLKVLQEAIEDDCKGKWVAYYADRKLELLLSVEKDWKLSYEKFPSARVEMVNATDCYCLNQFTASVFHSMRVAEYGLRALARERNIKLRNNQPMDFATWGTILGAVEKTLEVLEGKKRGPARARALEFYSGAIREISALKNCRDDVMHARTTYDEEQARSVMGHARDFMEGLAAKIGEKPKAIKWGKM